MACAARVDCLQIVEGPVHEAAGQLVAGNRGHERRRPGREHERVVIDHHAARRGDRLRRGAYRDHPVAEVNLDGVVRARSHERQFLGCRARHPRAQADAVVGEPVLLTEHDEFEIGAVGVREQLVDHFVPDHAVAGDDNSLAHAATGVRARAGASSWAKLERR